MSRESGPGFDLDSKHPWLYNPQITLISSQGKEHVNHLNQNSTKCVPISYRGSNPSYPFLGFITPFITSSDPRCTFYWASLSKLGAFRAPVEGQPNQLQLVQPVELWMFPKNRGGKTTQIIPF